MAAWENDPVAVQDWQSDPVAESWKSDPIDTARMVKRESMQDQQRVLQGEGLADEIVTKVLTATEGVVGKIAYPIPAILEFPEHLARIAGVTPPSAQVPALSQETALKAVEAITPGGAASEGTTGQSLQELAAGLISGSTTPSMVAGILAAGKAPIPIGRVFQAEMAAHIPQAAINVVQAEPGQATTAAALELGVNVAFPALIERGISKATPKQILVERAAEVGPATEAVVKQASSPAKPASFESSPDARKADAQMLSDLTKTPAFLSEGYSGLDAPSQNVVQSAMLRLGNDPQVRKAIIELIPVDVVNLLKSRELTPDALFDNPSVLSDLATIYSDNPVAMNRDSASAAVEAVASAAAKLGGTSRESTVTAGLNLPAVRTSERTEGVHPVEVLQNPSAPSITSVDTSGRISTAQPRVERVTELEAPELVGMGAATPAEYANSPQTATGIKNRTVDLERAKRDLPPAMETGKQSFGEAWDRAMAKMDKDPIYQERLVAELADKPRAVTDIEDAVLLHRQIDLQNEYGKATRAMAQAFDDGRMEDVAHEQGRVAALSDQLLDIYNINQAVGTETGRGLAARKMMAYEDFSLAKMEVERRAAKGGEQLTPEERAEVVTLQKKIETTQKAYDAYVAKTTQQISALEMKAALTSVTQKAQANVPPKVLEIAKRIVDNLHREADAARQRIKERGIVFGSGPLHEIPNIRDFAIIGADHIVTTGVKFTEWSGKMIKEFGEGIKPHLKAIFEESQKAMNAIDQSSPFVQPVKRARAKPDKQESKLSYEATQSKKEWQQTLQKERMAQRTTVAKVFDAGAETVNMARVLMTTGEFSAVLKQGGFTAVSHPLRSSKSLPALFKALRSEAGAHGINLEIASRENYPKFVRSKLFLAEHGHSLSKMEEATMSRWADKIPVLKGFQRSHPTFLNKLRADSWDALAATLVRRGHELTPEREALLSDFINMSTGRATFGRLEKSQAAVEIFTRMNQLFFAPRWVWSRFQLATGVPIWRALKAKDPAMVRLFAEEYARFLTGLGVIYGLWTMAGGEIGTDPKATDFGKLKVGETDVDLMAGLQQGTVLMTRLATGEKTTGKGKTVPIVGEKIPYRGENAFDVTTRFLRTKLAPVPASAIDLRLEKDVVNRTVTLESEMQELSVPMTYRDIYKAMREHGTPADAALSLLAMFGAGVQTKDE